VLTSVAPGAFAWLASGGASGPTGGPVPGTPNAGVVIDADGLTLVDTLAVPSQYVPFGEAVDQLAEQAGVPLRRVVLTSSTIDAVGGTSHFWKAGFYGSAQVSAHLDQPPQVEILRRLYPELAAELPDDLRTHPVTHVVAEPALISAAVQVTPVRGPLQECVVASLPSAGVVYAGAVAAFGMAPLCYQGDPAGWADDLDVVLQLGSTVVPGHGPVGGPDDVRALQAYLRACVSAAAAGRTALEAGPWEMWSAREHDQINVERAAIVAAGRDDVPPTMLVRAGLA
jgi:cyclase